jgi:hypothetical protein
MKRSLATVALLAMFAGCATFKELEPKPEVSPQERGYIELKSDKDNFELEKDKKYFIKFPAPMADHFALVLVTGIKPVLHMYLTEQFDDGEGRIVPIPDQAAGSDSVSVYVIGVRVPTYYWVIDSVGRDVLLTLRYRYVPQWRYTFEQKYATYQEILAKNTVDRSTFDAIDMGYNIEGLNLAREVGTLDDRMSAVEGMNKELKDLARIFPPGIAATRDTAYQQYTLLREKTEAELDFQQRYSSVLGMFKKERDTRGNPQAFLETAPLFTNVLESPGRFPAHIVNRAKSDVMKRLAEIGPYYDTMVMAKQNTKRFDPQPSYDHAAALYRACGQPMPTSTAAVLRFIERFNVESAALQSGQEKLASLRTRFQRDLPTSDESFYTDFLARARDIDAAFPEPQVARFERYGTSTCGTLMARELGGARAKAADLSLLFQEASSVPPLLASGMWGAAEGKLRAMYDNSLYRDVGGIADLRELAVKRFEQQIFQGVEQMSRQHVDAFVKLHEATIDNVAALYQDSAFTPVYQITFSSTGPNDLLARRKQIDDYLTQMKYVQFPENSIRTLYKDFQRNVNDRGVEKARAIAEHGKFYRGADKQVKSMADECTVETPKWISKAKEYRRVLALPVTSNRKGSNEYLFKIRLTIPSEAEFPVFDITLKLPPEVAANAGTRQWYESIMMNRQPVKNEGRFRITSPTADNNYESLITPVQMDKEGNNILEVRFSYPAFKVLEVSAMAQVPIIRKN